MKPSLAALAIMALSTSWIGARSVHAEVPMRSDPPITLSVSTQAQVLAVPDIATLSAGVMTQAPTAQAAMGDNARQMTQVMAALKAAGIADRDIQTAGLNLQPQYDYRNDQPPRLIGYQAVNTLSVTVRKLDRIGATLDALVGKGVNQISGPTFTVDKPEALLDKARADAVTKAMARARLYAQAAGLKVRRVLSITEGGAMPPPMPIEGVRMRAMAADAAPTPVSPGQVDLGATVNVTFELME